MKNKALKHCLLYLHIYWLLCVLVLKLMRLRKYEAHFLETALLRFICNDYRQIHQRDISFGLSLK